MAGTEARINLDEPRFDQSTYSGRAKHFFITTNPFNIFASPSQLDQAKALVESYRECKEPPGTTADQVWKAKHLYDSAFHPDTKEKMFVIGRMSAQVPMNMTITGCMLAFYKTTPQVVFWQWANQSFNAIVNYTNRSGASPISTQHLGISYVAATTAATGSALIFKSLVKNLPSIVGRFVPFAAVAVANCVNIPCMRSKELMEGIAISTEDGEHVGESVSAAKTAIAKVVTSRVSMAIPVMVIPPLIMRRLEKGQFHKKYPIMNAPIQVGLVGVLLSLAIPMCCALFAQRSSISVSHIEPELQEKLRSMGSKDTVVYFNRGL